MPVASNVQDLIDALNSRKTNITRALDDLFGSQDALDTLKGHDHRSDLATQWVLGGNPGDALPPWAKNELQAAPPPQSSGLVQHPLSPDEIAHIQKWPPQQKESLRAVLDNAIEQGQPLQFFWELHGGNSEEMDTSVAGQVVFRSPQKNVSASGLFKPFVKVSVKVGP